MSSDLSATAEALWTQKEAAAFLRVSVSYIRNSECPKVLLPGNGPKTKPLVRYDPAEVRAFAEARSTKRKAS